ncbi:MAG: hypothetical protein HQM13_22185 [SAR324 cluster bacterium]|nr:hypothetical protein [SAR324 cluster bacterium]
MNAFFEFLTGHNLARLEEGKLGFGMPVSGTVVWLVIVIVIAGVWLIYRRTTIKVSMPVKALLIGMRSLLLLLLCLLLLQPQLSTLTIMPQESYLAVVVDNSRSMTIEDMEDKQSRGKVVKDLLYGKNSLLADLQENFRIRIYGFDKELQRIANPEDLTFSGSRTAFSSNLEQVVEDLKGFPIAGLILLSDGGDNSSQDPVRAAAILKSMNIPVFSVGVGEETIEKDLEITRINSSKTVMEGSIFDVNVLVRNQGFEGREVDLQVEEDGKMLVSKTVKLGKSGTIGRYNLKLTPTQEGNVVYTLRIPEKDGEIITRNNRRNFLVSNQQNQADILYIEGHPRHEYKFIQRAVQADQSLRLVTYLQTGPHKFLRQGIKDPKELEQGYPLTAEELFQYEAVIFGDIPKAFFSDEQLAMTEEFVSRRGAGFLMLGGTTAFEENFIGTPIADILPITLLDQSQLPPELQGGLKKGNHPTGEKFRLALTSAGREASLLRMGLEEEINSQLWSEMPELQGINVTGWAKPGAEVLATHPSLLYQERLLPVMAYQRYGRGRTMAIMTASTWRWQMLMPHKDQSHERFWRQILRWLSSNSPSRLELTLDHDSYSVGEQVIVQARVTDKNYSPINDATVWLQITDPAGALQDIQLKWDIGEDGIYRGTFMVQEEGVFRMDVSSTTFERDKQEASTQFLVSASNLEFSNPGMDAELLRKIAETSNGKFYTSRSSSELIDDVKHIPNAYSVEEKIDLWDMPIVLLLLFGLIGFEWSFRRWKGMS